MDLLDFIILVISVLVCIRGSIIGLIRQFCSSLGLFDGVLVGALIAPHLVSKQASPSFKLSITLTTILLMATLFITIAEHAGTKIKTQLIVTKLYLVDKYAGAIFGLLSVTVLVWLFNGALFKVPSLSLQNEIQSSTVISELNKLLPRTPSFMANIGSFIYPGSFPQLFITQEPKPQGTLSLPVSSSFDDVVNTVSKSVLKVDGKGCSGEIFGTGFVANQNMVITNAHVIAGTSPIFVMDADGQHLATPVLFDQSLDIAVLRVAGLKEPPLQLTNKVVPRGTQGIILGYPLGGNLKSSPATFLDEISTNSLQINGDVLSARNIYQINAIVQPGNSGSPIFARDGSVIGVVFAGSSTYTNEALALEMNQVYSDYTKALNASSAFGTGRCQEGSGSSSSS